MIDGKEYLLEDDEANYVKKIVAQGQKFVALDNGDVINSISISRIGALDTILMYDGKYPVGKDGVSIQSTNPPYKRLTLDKTEIDGYVKEQQHPKYLKMQSVKLLQ